MLVTVDISPPFPPTVGKSYGALNWYKFGVGCWVYQIANVNVNSAQFNFNIAIGGMGEYCGETEWINFQHFVTAPKLPNPIGFNYSFRPGVHGQATLVPQVTIQVPDVIIAGKATNLITGKGMPLLTPPVH